MLAIEEIQVVSMIKEASQAFTRASTVHVITSSVKFRNVEYFNPSLEDSTKNETTSLRNNFHGLSTGWGEGFNQRP